MAAKANPAGKNRKPAYLRVALLAAHLFFVRVRFHADRIAIRPELKSKKAVTLQIAAFLILRLAWIKFSYQKPQVGKIGFD